MKFLLILLALFSPIQSYTRPLNIVQTTGFYFSPLSFTFNNNTEYITVFPSSNSSYPYHVQVWTTNATIDNPVLVVVKQKREVLSWEVPFMVETSHQETQAQLHFSNTSRTLCHDKVDLVDQNLTNSLNQSFTVTLSTFSTKPVQVFVQVEEEKNFYIDDEVLYSLSVSPSQTRFVYYRFKNETDTVVVEMDSVDDVCLVVSVQDTICPVFDLDEDVTYQGNYQTVNRKGAMTITKKKFPQGFFLVFVAKADNFACSQENSIFPMNDVHINYDNRTSVVNFVIRQSISSKDYSHAYFVTLTSLICFCLIALLSNWIFVCYRKPYIIIRKAAGDAEPEEVNPINMAQISLLLRSANLYVNNLSWYPLRSKRRSFNYLWHIMSIAIFYAIPVVQLVLKYLTVMNQTGNQDMCYYNFRCAHPAFGLSDFNHFLSNSGYIVIGISFLIVVYCKQKAVPMLTEYGLPVYYGLYYAMGVALCMEGVLSACYHICPTQANFQFDTSFMYIMMVLCMVKLYQNRHPDINATAYATFNVLGITIFLAMVGILNESIAIQIGFIILYFLLCIFISCKIYFLTFSLKGLKRLKTDFSERGFQAEVFAPVKQARFVILAVANFLNFALVIVGLYFYHTKIIDFGTFLLFLLLANTLLHLFFYMYMKVKKGERICWEAIIYALFAIAFWIPALVFFFDNSILWSLTPAESRLKNQECYFLNFYDKHDMWHLLSAPALYFSFMLLLSLDNDLLDKKQTEIPVF